mmetsp:Transcript_10297/g.15463  ORF Transcript_10297/g.15463 Transcript_10297/m.15463 type:complete len:672 (-) Transcript_10297:785-2800(-)|eukprot:CAMPEP_0170072604 /NCGR_PEP_ID=MMETSP0019_2-20121128/10210_1 /TAXON_ID=98059 /ORGANISM="Dinobryon sp., Strain UTEXLB2267" /LENGTH=671 /DNA_ID=CAMNT_0010281677 /DNA_START=128 /DNA_END=2143 /DNA_ORIENTATION=-
MNHIEAFLYGGKAQEVLQENRPESFIEIKRSPQHMQHEVIFAVKPNEVGLEELRLMVDDISSPSSTRYQQWLTYSTVGDLVSNHESTKNVTFWLETTYSYCSENNEKEVASVDWKSTHGDYIKASASICHWEKLFKTEFYEFSDRQRTFSSKISERPVHRARHYSLPLHIEPHLFAVFNTVQAPPVLSQRHHLISSEEGDPLPQQAASKSPVTVQFLNQLYDLTSNKASSALSQSVFETASEYFSPSDLKLFQQTYKLRELPAVSIGDQATSSPCSTSGGSPSCFEGNLDIQYISGLAQLASSIYWYVPSGKGYTDPFVAWITAVANTQQPPQSNAISWSSLEMYMTASVMTAFNTQALKLAAMGVTIAVASGDDGAPNSYYPGNSNTAQCMCSLDSSSSNKKNYWTSSTGPGGGAVTKSGWSGQGYFPYFPASCPYVTAVGATMGPEYGNPEVACQSQQGGVISSGGGFSTFFAQPAWQQPTVAAYLRAANASALTTPAAGFNPRGRAYPDLALIGVNYQVMVAGKLVGMYGTSASAPVFAAFITLLNTARRAAGQPAVGFINPSLYSAGRNRSGLFTDVTSGSNKCCSTGVPASPGPGPVCCSSGFTALPGWDPVTGWGSLGMSQLSKLFNSSSLAADSYSGAAWQHSSTHWAFSLTAVLCIFWLSTCF